MYKTITYIIKDDVAIITLSNPPSNILSFQFFDELSDIVFNRLAHDSYSGLIIQSEGRHFSQGSEIKELIKSVKENSEIETSQILLNNLKTFNALRSLNKIKVALIKGICYGSGFELALCADYRIASRNALVCLPETSFGLMPGLGGVFSVTTISGQAKAMDFILSGNALNSEEALKCNLINEIAEKENLLNAGFDYIKLNFNSR